MTKASALAFHEGLSAELRSKNHGFNAPEVKMTCVHPTWASTAMIAPHRSQIDRSGMAILEPQTVADAVVKQVLSGRGRQIVLAPGVELISTVRAWPSWLSGGLGMIGGELDVVRDVLKGLFADIRVFRTSGALMWWPRLRAKRLRVLVEYEIIKTPQQPHSSSVSCISDLCHRNGTSTRRHTSFVGPMRLEPSNRR